MNAPPFEVADIIQAAGRSFIEKNRSRLTWQHLRVLRAIERCRTAALGGHLDQCPRCGQQAISYNSCRNRHCPKCQTNARDKWLTARDPELLNVPYVHVVFTLPHQLSPLALANKRFLYDLLFRASAATLLEIAADPKHLGAKIGFMERAAYVGSERPASSTRPLRDSGRWSIARSPTLDSPTLCILSTRESAQSCVPR
jgi:hypothetical protein